MPYTGNVLQRLYNWVNDKNAGIKILSSKMDGEFNNVFDGVNQILQGTVPFSGQIKNSSGTQATPIYSFTDDTDTGLYRISTNKIGISVGGQNILTLASDEFKFKTQNILTSVDTVATLRNTEPSYNGQIIALLGHTTAGIGAGQFRHDATDTTTADDDGVTIVTDFKRLA
jgi:hypothetical protein